MFSGWAESLVTACAFLTIARSGQLRDRLCGEAYDLGSSFADAENHIDREQGKTDTAICQR